MTLCSMTGFARAGGSFSDYSWNWEIKSVNGKGLDVRCRLPAGIDSIEQPARALIKENFARGNFQVGLHVTRQTNGTNLTINDAALEQVLAALGALSERMETVSPSPVEILAMRGVLETTEASETDEELALRDTALLASLKEAVQDLKKVRRAEGAHLQSVLGSAVLEIKQLSKNARDSEWIQPVAIQNRLKAQVDEILGAAPSLPEERLAHEVALLMVKADIREEIDRLDAHAMAMDELLNSAAPVGRQLDFLMQELNREANTLCSKAADVALTRIGLDLKAVIDQAREQVQNIE